MRIRLFGGLEIVATDGQPVHFATRKSALLVAALVLAGRRGLRREKLAEILWPGRGSVQSRNSLRQALVDIRRSLSSNKDSGILIGGDHDHLSLDADAGEADVWLFEKKLEEGHPAALSQAAGIYRGDILEGETLPTGPDDWFRPYQAKYHKQAEILAERLSLSLVNAGTEEEVACESLAGRILALDPAAEAAHRALMRIYALKGQENAAARQFEACRIALRNELDVEPEAQTSALADALKHGGTGENERAILEAGTREASPELSATQRFNDRPSVAIMPFQNLSSDAEQEYFADGIVEEIITVLASFRHLYVIARNSSFALKDKVADIKQVGHALNARYVVEGSVRRTGNRLRISGQLIDASTGANLWANRFDGTLADIFDLQDQIAASIVGAITPKVEEAEIERAKRKPTESLDAYDYYLRGLAYFDRTVTTSSAIDEALVLFTKAVEHDADFALAYARAARCYATRKSNNWMENRAAETAEAIRLARRAVELGRDDATALSYAAFVLAYIGGDLVDSAACIDRALELNPSLAIALGTSSWVNVCLGNPEKAIEHAMLAMQLSPLEPRLSAWQFNTSLACFCAGRYDDAVAWAGKALVHQPNYVSAMRVMAAGHAMAGRVADAQKAIARLSAIDPGLRLSNVEGVLPPFRRDGDRVRYIDALRKAGLSE